MPDAGASCYRCIHYFVTWDERFPHGCRRMGFKSRVIPGIEVRRAMSGRECVLFEPKAGARKELTNPC